MYYIIYQRLAFPLIKDILQNNFSVVLSCLSIISAKRIQEKSFFTYHLLFFPLVYQVIIRDIVSKVVISQFRAHKSPISALCFDPSGTLLVTASVQGHNINVFKIMPGLQGSSSACDAPASYAHLYRLQRGFTNAVRPALVFCVILTCC